MASLMNDLLLIQILGNLRHVLLIISLSTIVFLVILGGALYFDYDKIPPKKFFISLIISISVFSISGILPSENQMYISYGVGSVIDSMKEHKEIPDKIYKALDKWLDNISNK